MSESKPRRKLAAILAADVVGFSRMMGENEDRTLHNLKVRDDYRSIFVPNSALADPIIEGLVKAGWEPEG